MMFWIGLGLIVFGAIVGFIGYVLNTETPIQQPLPVVGICIALIGLGMVLWFH